MGYTYNTIRIYSQAIELFRQGEILKLVYEDMKEVWLSLYTKDKTCPIVDQVGTNVKRLLVRKYTVSLIRHMRNTIGLDIVSKVIDPDAVYWHVDDIVLRVADNKTEDHLSFFRSLVSAIFGLSIKILDFMLLEKKTKGDLYTLLNDLYDVQVNDLGYDDELTEERLKEDLNAFLYEDSKGMFQAMEY